MHILNNESFNYKAIWTADSLNSKGIKHKRSVNILNINSKRERNGYLIKRIKRWKSKVPKNSFDFHK